MSYEKYMLTREAEQTILDLPYEEDEEKIEITIRPLSWSKKNAVVSQCTNYTGDGSVRFDGQKYINEVLNDMFLAKVNLTLGQALEQIVPSATDSDVVEQSENLA